MDSSAHISVAGLSWKSTRGGNIPQGAVEGGHRASGSEPLYVACVLAPDGKYHPAKACRSASDGAHYYYDNTEKTSMNYYALVSDPNVVTLKWVKAFNGKTPAYAVQGERGELYVGRHQQGGELIIGEVNTAQCICIVVTGWNAYKFSDYEVLCAIPHASTA